MSELQRQVRSYLLNAEGYQEEKSSARDQMVFKRITVGGDIEYIYAWVPAEYDPSTFASRENYFISLFEKAHHENPMARRFMIVPTLEGLSRNFRSTAANQLGVKIRTPIQFFDTEFKWEVSRDAPSAARAVADEGKKARDLRVPQPFEPMDTTDYTRGERTGPDLLDVLLDWAMDRSGQKKPIHIVIGPAGVGKSYLFNVLFASLHEKFHDYKRGGPYAPRPVPVLPQYIRDVHAPTVKNVLRSYLESDLVRPVPPATFEWMLVNGFAVWMIDGLDEVLMRDPSFFEDYLLDLLTREGQAPKVLICVREALLETCGALKDFIAEYPSVVAIYRLARWNRESKQQFAEKTLKAEAGKFLNILRASPVLDDLASTPFYCHLLSKLFQANRLDRDYSEDSLVEQALEDLLDRDYEKGFLDRAVVRPADVIELLEAVAAENFERNLGGVPIESLEELAAVLLPETLTESEGERIRQSIPALGVFVPTMPGYVTLLHDVIEQFLLGKRLVRLFERGDSRLFVSELAKRDVPDDWLTARLVAEHIRKSQAFERLKGLIDLAMPHPVALKNILKLAIRCAPDQSALRDIRYERLNLAGVNFKYLDLRNVSFSGCDLTDTEFRGCNLSGAIFVGAILKNTGFFDIPPGGLMGARFGDLSRFFSIRIGQGRTVRAMSKLEEVAGWIRKQTGEAEATVRPCEAALQLRHLFGKFVRPDGTQRASALPRRAVLRGESFGVQAKDVLEAAVDLGYLREERYRDRDWIRRPDSPLYAEMVRFVEALQPTPGIKAILDKVCKRKQRGCPHVPTSV